MTTGAPAGPRTCSSGAGGGTGAEDRSPMPSSLAPAWRRGTAAARRASALEDVQGVEEQVGARQVAGRGGFMAPAHERPLREAARVQDAERPAGRAFGLEVGELLDVDAELLLERLLGVGRVAGHAVERRPALGQVLAHLVVDRELARAYRRERERVE